MQSPYGPHILTRAAAICGAAAHAQRAAIILALADGERDVTSICDALGCSQSRTSQQLALLRREGVVAARRDGRRIFYHLPDARVAGWVHEACRIAASAN